MFVHFKDGRFEIADENNQERIIEDSLREYCGEDLVTVFRDVIYSHESGWYDAIDEEMVLTDNIESLLYNWEDYMKATDALKEMLESLHKRLNDFADNVARRMEV